MKIIRYLLLIGASAAISLGSMMVLPVYAAKNTPKVEQTTPKPTKKVVVKKEKVVRKERVIGTVIAVTNSGFTVATQGMSAFFVKDSKKGSEKTVTVITDTKTKRQSLNKVTDKTSKTKAVSVAVGDRVMAVGTFDKTASVLSASQVTVVPKEKFNKTQFSKTANKNTNSLKNIKPLQKK